MERTRNLFQRCLDGCPAQEESSEILLLFGALEEEHGLTRRALGVYRSRCVRRFRTWASRQRGTFKRPFIAALPDRPDPPHKMCIDFSKMESVPARTNWIGLLVPF
jgi:hypothetical protein